MFAVGSLTLGTLFLSITEDDLTEYDDDTPMTLTELQDSIRRVLGADVHLGEPTRLSRPEND